MDIQEKLSPYTKYLLAGLVLVVFFVTFVLLSPHTPFEGQWKESNTDMVWNFGSTGYGIKDSSGLITRNGDYSYTTSTMTCLSHPSGSPKVKSSVTYIYRLEGDRLYFDSPVKLVFTRIR